MSKLAPIDAAKTDANGWLPIETAPKDGSEFLVWFPSQKEVGYGFYVEADYGYSATFRFFWFEVEEAADLNQLDEMPSHWQHLPKPPVSHLPSGAAACSADSPTTTSSPSSGTNSTVFMQEPRVEGEGQAGAGEHGRVEGSQTRLPSDRAENKPDAPAVIAGEPHSIAGV